MPQASSRKQTITDSSGPEKRMRLPRRQRKGCTTITKRTRLPYTATGINDEMNSPCRITSSKK